MRQYKYYVSLFICLASFSCVTFKQFDNRAEAAREKSYEASIVKDNGEVITGKTLKHKNRDPYDPNLVRVTNNPGAFTLDGKKYNDNDVTAFQDGKAFHQRYRNVFLVRLIRGRINLYYFDNTGYDKTYTFYSGGPTAVNSNSTRKSTFFFEKEPDKILTIGLSDLRNAVKDNPKALAKLNAFYPKDAYAKELNIEKLVSVVETYNQ